jgi:hypothetical protein
MKNAKADIYKDLIQAIIDKQKEILGVQVATERARRVEDLWVSAEGDVLQIKGESEHVLQSLLNEYFKLTTQAGLDACVAVVREFVKKNADIKLPEEIAVLVKEESGE